MEKYTLIITEKPNAAERIANSLDYGGKPQKVDERGVPYFVATRDRKLVIASSLGHLYTVAQEKGPKDDYPIFTIKWMPRFLAERGANRTRVWIETISRLAKKADVFLHACDYDMEGSLIGYSILKYACGKKEHVSKRMKFSTLTQREIIDAYEKPLSKLDFGLIEAGRTRHELDWLYGVNLSRALTLAAKRWSGRYFTLSTGRVQGPTLKLLSDREKAIRSFVPTPYWEIKAEIEIKKRTYEVEYIKKRITDPDEAEAVVKACRNQLAKISQIDTKIVYQKPPIPFNLSSLQKEAYNLLGYTPKRTMLLAQRLYLDALISYPRTSSQKLPSVIDYRRILEALRKEGTYTENANKLLIMKELKPKEGAEDDPAHPAVYPTGNLPKRPLTNPEKRLWNLIVRRFMALFGEPAIKQRTQIRVEVKNYVFFLQGTQIRRYGWLQYYEPFARSRTEEALLPSIRKGETAHFQQIISLKKFTSPPPRFNPSSLLKKMEDQGVGTKATRADIIETLFKRKYIKNERIVVTDLGFDIVEILQKYAPKVISLKLTQEFESKMKRVQTNLEKRENILAEAIEKLKLQLESFKTKETLIGEMLSQAIENAKMQKRTIGDCPTCHTGKLVILHSRKTGKRFAGCTNYFKNKCNTSFPLPQTGRVQPTNENCSFCRWPIIQYSRARQRKGWKFCLNPDCPSKRK